MKFIFTLLMVLILAYGRCQITNVHIDSLDTVVNGDVAYVYYHKIILERLHYIGDKIDVTVLYIYREGLLVRREWWREGKMISYTMEN